MLTEDAIKFFGNKAKIIEALGYSNGAVYRWGKIVPASSAGRLYLLSKGEIPFREEDYVCKKK